MYVLTDKKVLGREYGIPIIQLMDHMKLKRMEDQSMDSLVLVRRGNKIIKGSQGWKVLGRNRGGRGEMGKLQIWEEIEEMYKVSGN